LCAAIAPPDSREHACIFGGRGRAPKLRDSSMTLPMTDGLAGWRGGGRAEWNAEERRGTRDKASCVTRRYPKEKNESNETSAMQV
jgi:hypothetical protein